jgi:hypothetical protein
MSKWSWKQAVAEQVLDIVNARSSPHLRLEDVYSREESLQRRFPANRHVREKIRQTLQRLRDDGLLAFHGDGAYSVNMEFEDLDLESAGPGEEGISIPGTRVVVRTIRLRNTLLATDIKRRYDNRCQVCRETVRLRDRGYAEAHHLKPLGSPHFGPDIEGNIIVVCPNHHVMFDRGALRIDRRSLIVSHMAGALDDRRLYLKKWHTLNLECLRYHAATICEIV